MLTVSMLKAEFHCVVFLEVLLLSNHSKYLTALSKLSLEKEMEDRVCEPPKTQTIGTWVSLGAWAHIH